VRLKLNSQLQVLLFRANTLASVESGNSVYPNRILTAYTEGEATTDPQLSPWLLGISRVLRRNPIENRAFQFVVDKNLEPE